MKILPLVLIYFTKSASVSSVRTIRHTSCRRYLLFAASSRRPRSSSMAAPNTPKAKILALHGYLQNADVFRNKTGSLRKGLKSVADLIYVEAPHFAQVNDAGDLAGSGGEAEGGRSWWQWSDQREDGSIERPSQAKTYVGIEETIDMLKEAVRIHQPDGILGFSQGATATALLLASLPAEEEEERRKKEEATTTPKKEERRTTTNSSLKFAILAGSFLPQDASVADYIKQSRPSLPTLFILGTNDTLVPPQRSLDLMNCFDGDPILHEHPGGHMVPTCSGEFKSKLIEFIKSKCGGDG